MQDENTGNTIPRRPLNEAEKVEEVVKSCGIDDYRAIALLGEHDGDVAATIAFYKELMEPILPKMNPKAEGGLPPTPPEPEDRIFTPSTGAESVASFHTTDGNDNDRKRNALPEQEGTDDGGQVGNAQENPEAEDHNDDAGSNRGDRVPEESDPMSSDPPHTMDGGEEEGVAEPPQEWDFVLPKVPMPEDLVGGGRDGGDYFSMQEVIGAIQGGMSFQKIHSYLGYYDTTMVTRRINEEIQGVPSMFFVVASNNEMLLRLCVGYGGDVNATYGPRKIPLIGFAVINSDIIQNDTTLIVATLLSLGAKCTTIPKAFYSPFCTDLPIEGPDEADLHDIQDKNKQWCTSFVRSWLAKSLNLSQRYYLEKALHTKKASLRQKQVALRRNAEGLLGIHYFLIGQTMAARWLMQKLLSYMILPSKRPLVLVFAGPSGHGKTELARQLGHLLSLELEVVDCTIYNREMELFGGRAPFVGSERGTPLNNFLARKAGQKCVVFLDEFEKTTDDIHNALLIPFDKGEYQDRRNNGIVDCSKTLWILATNALDGTIMDFCRQHEKAIFVDDNMDNLGKLMKMLEKDLKTGFKGETSAPLTGRISSFVPFLPFTSGEQCVVAHKYILELAHRIRAPVSLSPGPDERLLGNVYLKVRRDATVCKALAEEGYDRDLGARSLINAVKTEVEIAVVESYLEVDREIEEGQGTEEFLADYRNGTVEVKRVGRADDGEDEESRDSEDDE